MKSRVDENSSFLHDLSKRKSIHRSKQILLKANEEEIKTIVECIVNLHKLPFAVDEEKCLKKHKKIISRLSKEIVGKIYSNLDKLKKFLIKHVRVLKLIISCVLALALHLDISSVLTNGESNESND